MKTLLIAHRGAQKIAPENTLLAFNLAIQHGFKAIECDVQLTQDNHLVVIHDETLNRTTNGEGWVSHQTFARLEGLILDGSEHIPTLQEVIGVVVAKAHRKLIIEIKGDSEMHAHRVAIKLAEHLHRLPMQITKYIEVHSFWYAALLDFKEHCPHITTGAIINGGFTSEDIIRIAQKSHADGVSLNYEFLSKKAIHACHQAGFFVDTWAISDGSVLKRLRKFGLNAIVENYIA